MTWEPDGETEYLNEPRTKEQLLEELANHEWAGLKDFIDCIKEDDLVYYESESNHNRGFSRYVGRRKSGMTYCIVISSIIS